MSDGLLKTLPAGVHTTNAVGWITFPNSAANSAAHGLSIRSTKPHAARRVSHGLALKEMRPICGIEVDERRLSHGLICSMFATPIGGNQTLTQRL
jgi:hypothetical protein